MPNQPIDLLGNRFGRLSVLALHPARSPDRQALWLCKCDCGTQRLFKGRDLRCGDSRSCGCTAPVSSRHRLWRRWYNMVVRCTNPNAPDYERYGARGIRVCKRWLSFENFLSDMEPTFREGLTLDRKDNDLGYDPSNCMWVTKKENTNNRRTTRYLNTPWGRMTLLDAAKKSGLTPECLYMRTYKNWPNERLFEPVMNRAAVRKSTSSRRPTHSAKTFHPEKAAPQRKAQFQKRRRRDGGA